MITIFPEQVNMLRLIEAVQVHVFFTKFTITNTLNSSANTNNQPSTGGGLLGVLWIFYKLSTINNNYPTLAKLTTP